MPKFFTNPSLLTKDKLKAELEANGISLPRSDQKKDFYVNLYLQHLTPRNKTDSPGKPDFYSSDEEESTPRRRSMKKLPPLKKYKAPKREKDLPFDVLALSDGDLARQLRVLGATVGPITDSTRPLYQKKLGQLLTEEAKNPPSRSVPAQSVKNASPPRRRQQPEEYSADEKEESEDAAEDNGQEEDMDIEENSVDEKDEPDAEPMQQMNRTSFARKRYVPPKSVPEPDPVPAPTRRSLRSRANTQDVVTTTVTKKEVKGQQEKAQAVDDDGDGFASTLKFVLFAVAAMLLLVLMVYVVMEANPPNPPSLGGKQTSPPAQNA